MTPAMWKLIIVTFGLLAFVERCLAYGQGDFVPMSRRGQYHSLRTKWIDQLGRHCPRFGIDNEVVLPLPKPQGYTGADPYKISLQFGSEKYQTPWLFVIGRSSMDVPMIDVTLRYAGSEFLGSTAKVVSMPDSYLKEHPDIKTNYWEPNSWPKHILVRYSWEEGSEIDVAGGLYVLFGSGLVLTVAMALHILQSSKDKLSRFIKENVVETAMPAEEAKVE
ncbi:hypothetical protein R1sor_016942 [Riccia sorocarpa]|uniref:Uncharacterized protein n=1 Tax=Riccia sorocarpa TaxID=122646 RepID=A0ABD3I8Z9_9MARC